MAKLASLPLPTLQNLLNQYKKHVKALQYSHGYSNSDIEGSIVRFENFINSPLATTLQNRLEEKAANTVWLAFNR